MRQKWTFRLTLLDCVENEFEKYLKDEALRNTQTAHAGVYQNELEWPKMTQNAPGWHCNETQRNETVHSDVNLAQQSKTGIQHSQ